MDDCDLSYEPMDVDVSNTSSNMNISNSELSTKVIVKKEKVSPQGSPQKSKHVKNESKPKETAQVVKKYHIKINRENRTYGRIKLVSPFLLFLIISIVTYQVLNFKCSDELNVMEIKKSLTRNLYGQPKAVETIVEMLSYNTSSKVLFFYGGTGVGKTFALSLIVGDLWNSSNVYHYTMPGFTNTFTTDFMVGLTMCKTSMLIVDDLTRTDIHIKSHIKDFIAKSEYLGKNVTIILIFNCDSTSKEFHKKCDESFYEELKEGFSEINAVKRYVKFEALTEEHLRMCIEKELGKRVIKGLDMERILKNFNVSLDGCKGVYTKMKYLNVGKR